MTDFADIRERLAEGYLLKDDGEIPIPGGFRDGAAARRDVARLLTEVDRQAELLDEAREATKKMLREFESVRNYSDDIRGEAFPLFGHGCTGVNLAQRLLSRLSERGEGS
jgi:hypothetical protein